MSGIGPERWQRIQCILDEVFELPSAAWPDHLARACGGDAGLRADVEALLAADSESGGILDAPGGMLIESVVCDSRSHESAPPQAGISPELLSRSEPFSALSPRIIDRMFRRMHERRFEAGSVILRQGDPGDSLMIVTEGTALGKVRSPDGEIHEIRSFEALDVFGEMALLTGEPRNAEVVAESAVSVLVLTASDFQDLASRHAELAAVLTELLAARLGRSIHDGLGGMTVGGCRIRHCIGRGGMAIVYEAEDVETGRNVALKMMNHRLTHDPRALQRFRREAEVLASLRHENVVTLYSNFSAYSTQFLVLEHCDGPDFEAILRRFGKLPETQVRALAGQLARALSYVHSRGILHRDLKPGNVLLDHRGQVKLSDFGLARPEVTRDDERITRGIALVGTPPYLAPEQIEGKTLDSRADIYSLGCLIYEMLHGRPLFPKTSTYELMELKRRFGLPDAARIGSGISEEMHRFLAGALRPKPEDRPTSLDDVAAWSGTVPEVWFGDFRGRVSAHDAITLETPKSSRGPARPG